MIYEKEYNKGLFSNTEQGINIQYFGLDLPEDHCFNTDFLCKDCTTHDGYKGVIIGFENNIQYRDCYYIVYVPELQKVKYELTMDAEFCKSVQL